MYDPPANLWALTIAGPAAIVAAACIALYSGAVRAGPGRKRAALLGGAAPVLLGGWYTATDVPLMAVLPITSLATLARAPRPAPSAAAPDRLPAGRRSSSPAQTAERTTHAEHRNR